MALYYATPLVDTISTGCDKIKHLRLKLIVSATAGNFVAKFYTLVTGLYAH